MQLKVLTYETLKWGCGFFDYDNDGDLDIVIANGHIYPQVDEAPELKESYRQLPTLLENDNGKLADRSRTAGPGMQERASGAGLAVGDYDNDGDLDLLLSVIDGPPLLLRNDTTSQGHWLKVRPVSRHGSPAINARVTLTTGISRQLRELRSGSSYQSQNAARGALRAGQGDDDRQPEDRLARRTGEGALRDQGRSDIDRARAQIAITLAQSISTRMNTRMSMRIATFTRRSRRGRRTFALRSLSDLHRIVK